MIERAYRLGSRFDSWGESFSYENWTAAFAAEGLSPQDYANRPRALDETLPWDRIDVGVTKAFFPARTRKGLPQRDDARLLHRLLRLRNS